MCTVQCYIALQGDGVTNFQKKKHYVTLEWPPIFDVKHQVKTEPDI